MVVTKQFICPQVSQSVQFSSLGAPPPPEAKPRQPHKKRGWGVINGVWYQRYSSVPTCQPRYLPTHLPTYLPSYLPTFLPNPLTSLRELSTVTYLTLTPGATTLWFPLGRPWDIWSELGSSPPYLSQNRATALGRDPPCCCNPFRLPVRVHWTTNPNPNPQARERGAGSSIV